MWMCFAATMNTKSHADSEREDIKYNLDEIDRMVANAKPKCMVGCAKILVCHTRVAIATDVVCWPRGTYLLIHICQKTSDI